jgi:hypothetical protein
MAITLNENMHVAPGSSVAPDKPMLFQTGHVTDSPATANR